MFWLKRKVSGTKEYAVVTADSGKTLESLARRLKVQVHGKGEQAKHLDLKGHRIALALRLGAVEKKDGS